MDAFAEDEDEFADCRCPKCGHNLCDGKICPHVLPFGDYFEASFDVERLFPTDPP